jgi:hypothetical protein
LLFAMRIDPGGGGRHSEPANDSLTSAVSAWAAILTALPLKAAFCH